MQSIFVLNKRSTRKGMYSGELSLEKIGVKCPEGNVLESSETVEHSQSM